MAIFASDTIANPHVIKRIGMGDQALNNPAIEISKPRVLNSNDI